ncbi:hypothetical protein V2K52_14920 [Pseudomonas alliivorans]|nr:hypothetical protein [Pseudomonas alliivorans]MEE4791036.1 hypothetical protein [Pseudomonas alliivorans]MEE4797187.1 hypothetical protein [Pseudomonas alliivorans]MEE4807984.1 hypothetical protein [Pseudomonas alliivorans]MEE4822490.1 hypothetical protein [Pseudomonas alliivorans]
MELHISDVSDWALFNAIAATLEQRLAVIARFTCLQGVAAKA